MKLLYSNNAVTTLAGPINPTTTTVVVQAGSGALFPNPEQNQYFTITLIPAATGVPGEIMWCTGRATDTLTVIRAQEGTTATSYIAGDSVSNQVTAGGLLAFAQIPTYAGNPNGNIAGQAGTAEVSPDAVWDTTDQLLWICTTGSSNPADAVWTNPNANGGLVNIQFFDAAGTFTYTPTAGTQTCDITIQAAFGAGGGAPSTTSGQYSIGAGGGAGGIARSRLSVGSATDQTITIGAGGTGVSGGAGNSGGSVSFGSLMSATGGGGGTQGLANANGTTAVQAGGAAGFASGGNVYNAHGQPGSPALGTSATNCISGCGAPGLFGGGAASIINTTSNGNPGSFGGGSGGASVSGGGAATGGAGAPGACIILEYA